MLLYSALSAAGAGSGSCAGAGAGAEVEAALGPKMEAEETGAGDAAGGGSVVGSAVDCSGRVDKESACATRNGAAEVPSPSRSMCSMLARSTETEFRRDGWQERLRYLSDLEERVGWRRRLRCARRGDGQSRSHGRWQGRHAPSIVFAGRAPVETKPRARQSVMGRRTAGKDTGKGLSRPAGRRQPGDGSNGGGKGFDSRQRDKGRRDSKVSCHAVSEVCPVSVSRG